MIDGVIYPVAATITATAALATAGFTAAIYRGFKRMERTIHGAEQNEAWPGLIDMVLRHREVLEEEDYL